jgi:hypothetical protein
MMISDNKLDLVGPLKGQKKKNTYNISKYYGKIKNK